MMYNPPKSGLTLNTKLSTLEGRWINGRVWLRMLIGLVICSLTLSLATRFSAQASSQVPTAKSIERRSVEPKRQHLHRDMSGACVPAGTAAFSKPVVLHPPVAPVESGLPSPPSYPSLYNRPPPSSRLIL
jgi:hypothetical protein